jgi:predicted metal-binding membrane protein
MGRIFRRDRALVLVALTLLSGLSCVYLIILAGDMAPDSIGSSMGNSTGAMTATMGQTVAAWTSATFAPILVMWLIMMVGMMVPSAAPMILLFAMLTRKQAGDEIQACASPCSWSLI